MKASDGLFLSIKFLKKLLKNVLLNDEHIFEKYSFKITQRCISTSDSTLAERLQSVGETASLLYNRIVENMGHGEKRLKDIVKKAAEEEEQPSAAKEEEKESAAAKEQQQDDGDERYDTVAKIKLVHEGKRVKIFRVTGNLNRPKT